jgi:hypothetical protein
MVEGTLFVHTNPGCDVALSGRIGLNNNFFWGLLLRKFGCFKKKVVDDCIN